MPSRLLPDRRHRTELVCHRGANAIAPENTYPAAQHCIDWQADWLEIDVNTSLDGVMYVFHGPGLERTTDGTGTLNDLTSHEVDRLDCGAWFAPRFAGERVPRLAEFLQWAKGRIKLFLDVKRAPLEDLVRLIDDTGLRDESFFWFGDATMARRFRAIDPGLTLKINVNSVAGIDHAVRAYGAAIVEFGLAEDTADLIDVCRTAGVSSMIRYGGDSTRAFESILSLAPDMANVDHPDRFLALRDRP